MKGKVGVSPSQQVHTGGFLCVCVGEGARGGGGVGGGGWGGGRDCPGEICTGM